MIYHIQMMTQIVFIDSIYLKPNTINGYNTSFLAYKYNLSQNSVRKIIRENKQMSEFENA